MQGWVWSWFLLELLPGLVQAQGTREESPFSQKNAWTVFAEYSNTSSHVVLGKARQREFMTLGGGYTRRLVRFWGTELGYHAEVRPVVFESDPVATEAQTVVPAPGVTPGTISFSGAIAPKCTNHSGTIVYPPFGTQPGETVDYTITCGRQWTFGQSFSPFGFKYTVNDRRRIQPYVLGTLGYMYASRPIPVSDAEAFNFVFDLGVGLEVYRAQHRSFSIETRVQHFSNNYTAASNPGVDNLLYGVSYSFGR